MLPRRWTGLLRRLQGVGAPGSFVRHGFGRQYQKGKKVSGEETTLSSYEGEWENDVMHGQGAFRWADGSSYEGSFHQGELHGFGRYEWPEGSAYDGAWARGQMSGQGQFDSRFDGSYLNGRFQRDCFQRHDGRWTDVRLEHARAERRAISEGDASSMSISRCFGQESLANALAGVSDEGLVPFLLSDASLAEPTTAWASSCGVIDPCSTVNVHEAAILRRRKSDWRQPFYVAMQAALLGERRWLTVLFKDEVLDAAAVGGGRTSAEAAERPAQGGRRAAAGAVADAKSMEAAGALPPLPDGWRLVHFMDESSLPLEAFSPKLFNGRQMCMPFLPAEIQDELEASLEAAGAFAMPASEQPGEAGLEEDGDAAAAEHAAASQPAAGGPLAISSSETLTKVYFLRFMLTATLKLPAGFTDDQIREYVLGRYGSHAPLHRVAVVLLTAATPKAEPS